MIVTGAGAGIGAAVARGFLQAGCSVVVNDVSEAALAHLVSNVEALPGSVATCVAAVGGEEAAAALVETAVSNFGGVDGLINCAGITRDRMIHKMSVEEFDSVILVHLRGTWLNCREVVRLWRDKAKQQAQDVVDPAERTFKKIVNVTSRSGLRGNPGQSNYAAAKAGIAGLTKTLALELGPLSINVNAVAPVARTAMTHTIDHGLHLAEGPEREAFLKARLARSALRWIGEADALVPTFLYLISQDSNYVSGQIFNVDGGANI